MKNRFLVRRIFLLLIVAIMMWTVLTAIFYSFVANPVFNRIKARELLPRAEIISQNAFNQHGMTFCTDLVEHAYELFGNWIYILDGDGSVRHHTPLPQPLDSLSDDLVSIVQTERTKLLESGLPYRLSQINLPVAGDRYMILAVPIKDAPVQGTTVFVQPMKEIGAGIQSLNFALLTSSLIVLVNMVIPVIIAAFRIVRPIESMRSVTIALSQGDFSRRADEKQEGEMGDLASSINKMAEDLSQSFQQLRDQTIHLKQIIDGIGEGIVAVDRQGSITQYNNRIYSVFGLDRHYADKAGPQSLLQDSRIDQFFDQAMADRKTVTCVIAKDHRQIQIVITPLLGEQQTVSGAVGLFRDITQAERLEQTRREYVANVSHELRTPLTAMRGLLEPLTEGMVTSPEQQKRYHDILLRETLRLSRLINDMLELSRIQADTSPVEQEALDLNVLVADVINNFSGIILDHDLKLMAEGIDKDLPLVWGNGDRIEQILVILIDNAVKFTPAEGSVKISTGTLYNGGYVEVEDTGSGIDPADLDHVFDRFYKEDKAHGEPGTGLGLSIAREISLQLGYDLQVESVKGQGSLFRLVIPYASDVMQSPSLLKDVYDTDQESHED
ncbi:MAG: HAMP domain-containing protein [Clostridiaceae bacterium]|nr:HAMP domain-containing protein [Clostridiaceae bacterium]